MPTTIYRPLASGVVALTRDGTVDTAVENGGQPRPATATETLWLTEAENADDLRAKGLAYLALASPTQAQTTKAVRALVMLALNALDDTTGT